MKNLKNLFRLIIAGATVTSCQKQPVANFTFDKDIYYAGDTIHLKDASTDAKKWKWTAPDGQTFTTKDLDYVIDSGYVGGYKSFTLEVSTKNGNKNSSISNSVFASQSISASDSFHVFGSPLYHPTRKYTLLSNGIWQMIATDSPDPHGFSLYLKIYLNCGSVPSVSNNYSLQASNSNLLSGQAYIEIGSSNDDVGFRYHSTSGILFITIDANHRINAFFSNVFAQDWFGSLSSTMNGALTCF